jgi:hypothetical protein
MNKMKVLVSLVFLFMSLANAKKPIIQSGSLQILK